MSYLVGLHGFQHSEASHVDDTNQVTLTGTWIQVHQRHDVLRILSGWRVSCDVDDLQEIRKKIQLATSKTFLLIVTHLVNQATARGVNVQSHVGVVALNCWWCCFADHFVV